MDSIGNISVRTPETVDLKTPIESVGSPRGSANKSAEEEEVGIEDWSDSSGSSSTRTASYSNLSAMVAELRAAEQAIHAGNSIDMVNGRQ